MSLYLRVAASKRVAALNRGCWGAGITDLAWARDYLDDMRDNVLHHRISEPARMGAFTRETV